MDYGDLEIELASRLNAYFATNGLSELFEGIPIPENEGEANRPFEKGSASIQYYKSDYQPTQNTNEVSQAETVFIRCTFQTTTLRGANGFYKLVGHLKTCLLGYKPINAITRLVIDDYDLQFYENNTFQPWMHLKCDTLNVQVLDDGEQPLGAFKNLTIVQTEEGLNTRSFGNEFSGDFNILQDNLDQHFRYNPNEI